LRISYFAEKIPFACKACFSKDHVSGGWDANRTAKMRLASILLLTSVFAIAAATSALAEPLTEHKALAPQDILWKPAPPAFPPGSEAAVLFGDPSKEGAFVVRVRAPKGYRVPLHTHPAPEVLTVLSGAVSYGVGRDGATSRLPAGGFSVMPPGLEHHVLIEEDAVVQINAMGPWRIDYVDPKDDPRKKAE
jgi:quercetin dioxygenase-like cupin family protein